MPVRASVKGPLRSRDEMARDVSIALTSALSERARFAVLNNICWEWTEGDDKYEGCTLWTNDARNEFVKRFDKPKRVRISGLRHEHAVPRCVVIRILSETPNKTSEAVLKILQQLLHGVIVTANQEARLREADLKDKLRNEMPKEFYHPGQSFHVPWLRYDRFKDETGFDRVPSTGDTCRQIVRFLRLHAKLETLMRE